MNVSLSFDGDLGLLDVVWMFLIALYQTLGWLKKQTRVHLKMAAWSTVHVDVNWPSSLKNCLIQHL